VSECFFLVPAYIDCPGYKAVKWVVVIWSLPLLAFFWTHLYLSTVTRDVKFVL